MIFQKPLDIMRGGGYNDLNLRSYAEEIFCSTPDKEVFCMKSAQKILALILAGVMALALLTGCGKATSLDRTIAEGIAEYHKSELAQLGGNNNNISVSYQVPELRRDIAPLFDENWITKGRNGDILNSNHMVNGKTVEATLTDILSPYISDASAVVFQAADVTDVKTPFMEALNLTNSKITFDNNIQSIDPASVTSMKIEVTHKTVNGRTYALAVMIAES